MSDDERVLRSFVATDEELRVLETITAVKRSKGQVPPAGGQRTVAVTDRRLLWFASELEDVSLDRVEEVDAEYVERNAAPPVVIGAGLLFVVGIFASIGAFLASVGDLLVVAMPALTGLAVFLGTRVFASVTGREGETRAGHRLRLRTDDGPVSVWGDDETAMDRITAAVAGEESTSVEGDDEGIPANDDRDEETVEANGQETTVEEADETGTESTATGDGTAR